MLRSAKKSAGYWTTYLQRFSPIFLLAGLLPVFLMFATSKQNYSLNTQAAKNLELRLWLEPAAVITSRGARVELEVKAAFENETELAPSLTVKLQPSSNIIIDHSTIQYPSPFRGQVVLDRIVVTAQTRGIHTISIPLENIQFPLANVTMITSPATIVVK
jgi:hypothetical protein